MILFIHTQGNIDPVYFTPVRFSPKMYATFGVISLCNLLWCDLSSLPNVTTGNQIWTTGYNLGIMGKFELDNPVP